VPSVLYNIYYIHVYIYIYHTYAYIYIYVCVCLSIHLSFYLSIVLSISIYLSICVYIYTYLFMYTLTLVQWRTCPVVLPSVSARRITTGCRNTGLIGDRCWVPSVLYAWNATPAVSHARRRGRACCRGSIHDCTMCG